MVHTLSTKQLQPNPFQPRGKIKNEEIEELAKSIKTYGILEPIVVAHTPAGYQIIAGERRWRAAQLIGLEEVPVYVKKTTPKGMLEMALVENVQRVDLNALERAQAFRQLMRNFNYSNSDLAEKVGKSPSYISNSLKLLDLPDAIADGLISGQITEGHARALSSINSETEMIRAYKIILKENASVRRAEELARRFKKDSLQLNSPFGTKPSIKINEQQLKQWQSRFNQFFHTKSNLKLTRSHRQTKVMITLKGSPEETQQDLEKIIGIAEKNN
ncbi:ParB/RepB/Spo0J family partition protein [Patescibacteria group bacterium]|nr:ParB/RepB/Spo0J family partition protein [Patescibacteria group bacterium]MBU1967115.1 ParB/RepB/Spo0J family partition protein [Patescibacteria group bacterium]MBU2543492.1 ParB/RepB/Spo0J family partition protein [Patescibacteria group bacterium]